MEMLDMNAAATHFQLTREKNDDLFCFFGRRSPSFSGCSKRASDSSIYLVASIFINKRR